MSLETIRDKLGKTISKNNWELVLPNRKRNLNDDCIFVRYTSKESRKGIGNLYRIQINIGDKVASLFDWNEKSRIKLFWDRSNTNLFLLQNSKDGMGYKLVKAKRAVVFTFSCAILFPINLPKNSTTAVFFDVNSDDSILIDLSKSVV